MRGELFVFALPLRRSLTSPTVIYYLHRELGACLNETSSSSLFDLALLPLLPKSCRSDYPLGELVSEFKGAKTPALFSIMQMKSGAGAFAIRFHDFA